MFFLQLHRLAEKLDAEQGRFAAVPGEADDFPGRRLNVLEDVALESFIVQAEVRALWVKVLFVQIIAIVTIEVANRPDRLDHDLKLTRRGFHAEDSTQKRRRSHHPPSSAAGSPRASAKKGSIYMRLPSAAAARLQTTSLTRY